MRNYIKILEYS